VFINVGRTSTIFHGVGGGEADPEAVYNLFDFKNYVMKIMP